MAKTRSRQPPAPVHVLRAELRGSKPKIFRTLEVRSDVTLAMLHHILQAAFRWHNCHLHQFQVGGRRIAPLADEPDLYGDEDDGEDEEEVLLGEVLPAAKHKLVYEYDFGDSWEVTVSVVRIVPPTPGEPPAPIARLTGGALAAPPEDCGGLGGFYELCEILKDKSHPEHEDRLEWLGDDFDPSEFDAKAVESRLEGLA